MTEALAFQSLSYDELFYIDGGSLKDIFITGGKILCTVGVIAGAAAASAGTGCLGTALAVAGAIVAIAVIWAI
ncbi:MAG: hypothetical protein GX271_01715 [Clostridiales bacterium]|jgi:hypothetical protein|nr:hypothetical protein [Clostridiales bacterium]